jgi:hypothetical protein
MQITLLWQGPQGNAGRLITLRKLSAKKCFGKAGEGETPSSWDKGRGSQGGGCTRAKAENTFTLEHGAKEGLWK